VCVLGGGKREGREHYSLLLRGLALVGTAGPNLGVSNYACATMTAVAAVTAMAATETHCEARGDAGVTPPPPPRSAAARLAYAR